MVPAPDANRTVRPPSPRARATGAARTRHRKNIGRASLLLLFLVVVQVFSAVLIGAQSGDIARAANRELAGLSAGDRVEVAGEVMSRSELQQQIDRAVVQAWVIPLVLGLIFLALFFWAQKSPLPAFATALAIFIILYAVQAALDPETIWQGVIGKALCIAALLVGLKSALSMRAAVNPLPR